MISRLLPISFFLGCVTLAQADAPSRPYGLAPRQSQKPFLNGRMPELGPAVSGNWKTVQAFPKLPFRNALGLCPYPNSRRLVVWEREGRVWSFENRPDVSDKKLMLDISGQCQGWDDSGLLGLAFHPQFVKNHFIYVSYTWVKPGTVVGDPNHRPPTDKPNRDRLARFTLDANGVAIPGSELVLIDQEARTVWHNGGGMFFHPKDGFLYFTDGDDEVDDSQIIDRNLFGGVFRIDVDERGGAISHPIPRQPANGHTAHYFIPNDNPFVGKPKALEEYYALGLRSPHRMTHDAVSGRTFIGDVGAGEREEIDIIEPSDPAGQNFQWPRIEGLRGDLTPPFLGINHRPVIDYNHGEGNAVIGGYVYRGKKWADDLYGRYIFGDNGNGHIWVLDETTTPASKLLLATLPNGPGPNTGSSYVGLSSFGMDQDGELYLCQMSSEAGHIYALERTGPPPARKPFPKLLSQTGAFSDTAKLIPAPGLTPYEVNSPLWSDGAVKSRWIALPEGGKIRFAAQGEWGFPQGTVLVKHFELPVDGAHPQTHRRLETRLLVLDASGSAYGVTYKWRADNSDADLITAGATEEVPIRTASGAMKSQTWNYPSQTDCLRCHTAAAGYVLGPKTRQLNRDVLYAEAQVTDNQLRAWSHAGMFEGALDEVKIPTFDKLTTIADASAPLEKRVRSYLDANCSHCHRPAGVHALWDGRYDTKLEETHILNGAVMNKLGVSGARVVNNGHLAESILFQRLRSTDALTKMPPVGRNVVDAPALDVISQWIGSLPPNLTSLPAPWVSDDVGTVGAPGEAIHHIGVFTVSASGADIWDSSDAFHFVSQPLQGNGQIVARVASILPTDPWAKACVMIRANNDPDQKHAMMVLTAAAGCSFQHRDGKGSGSASNDVGGPKAPTWIKVERRGATFSGFISSNGVDWKKIGEAHIEMPAKALIGLAVTAHNNSALCTAVFDHVEVKATP